MSSYLVTGSNKGIGFELVKQLSALPANQVSHIFAVSRRSTDVFSKLGLDRVASVVIPNLANISDVEKAAEEVSAKLDGRGLDVLINNAGTMPFTKGGKGKTQDMPAEELMSTMETNVTTALVVTSGFLPLLKKGKDKKIFNM